MFKKITLENFKGFTKEQSIELKPITLIYGANSSGKSSILQSLLLLKQTLEQSNDNNTILLPKGKYVDLGNFNEFISKHDAEKKLRIKVDLPDLMERILYRSIRSDKKIKTSVEIIFTQNKILEIDKFNIYVNNDLFITLQKTLEKINVYSYKYYPRSLRKNINHTPRLNYEITNINYNSELFNKIYTNFINNFPIMKPDDFSRGLLGDNDLESYNNYNLLKDFVINNDKNKILNEINKYYKRYIFNYTNFLPNVCLRRELKQPSLIENLPSYLLRENKLLPAIENLVDFASFVISDILSKIHYLGPLRKNPERYYIFNGNTSDYVGANGSDSTDILFENEDRILRLTNKWLETFTNYKLKPTQTSRKSKTKGVQNLYSIRLIDKITNADVNITDVGFGISQILPIIVQSCKSKNNLILIEQPEIHIHPKLQAELGSMFAETCEDNMFIIETHSENLLLRLKKLVRQGKLDKDNLSIIYVDKDETGSVCYSIKLDENGDFIDKWPNGFFEESFEELF